MPKMFVIYLKSGNKIVVIEQVAKVLYDSLKTTADQGISTNKNFQFINDVNGTPSFFDLCSVEAIFPQTGSLDETR